MQYLNSGCCNSLYAGATGELDGTNNLKFYFIDLIDAVVRGIGDPTLADRLYHTFEESTNENGDRMFDKANSGLVFETFYLLDKSSAPALIIVASDASHQGNLKQHPLYCKLSRWFIQVSELEQDLDSECPLFHSLLAQYTRFRAKQAIKMGSICLDATVC